MAQRSKNSRDEKGRWEVGGGGLKWGFKAEDNMRREVLEEYNAKPLEVRFLGYRDVIRNPSDGPANHWVALDFAVLVDPKDIRINEPDMFDDGAWFTLDNLPSPLHSQQKTFFAKYTKEIKSLLKAK